jgi:hypothetical protein
MLLSCLCCTRCRCLQRSSMLAAAQRSSMLAAAQRSQSRLRGDGRESLLHSCTLLVLCRLLVMLLHLLRYNTGMPPSYALVCDQL